MSGNATFSEFFPPNTTEGRCCARRRLSSPRPKFFGHHLAGGSTRDRTLEAVLDIQAVAWLAPHISRIASTHESIREIPAATATAVSATSLSAYDLPSGLASAGEFRHATSSGRYS
jgi:hypothetical protein